MKKTLIINSHPIKDRFNFAIARSYKPGALTTGADVNETITTLDQPGWYYRFMFGLPGVNQLKKSTLEFCDVKPVKVNFIGPAKSMKKI